MTPWSHWSNSPKACHERKARGSLLARPHLLLPRLLLPLGLAKEWSEGGEIHDEVVDPVQGPFERPFEVDEEHHAIAIGVIPNLVVPGIVEDEALALLPLADLVRDADPHLLPRLGN